MSTQGIGARNVFNGAGTQPVEYRRVYVWELPVRVYHWINAVALVLLCVTGYMIGAPVRMFYASEAYQQYWFGWVRFYSLRRRVCLRLQLRGPHLLGLRRQQVLKLAQLLPDYSPRNGRRLWT